MSKTTITMCDIENCRDEATANLPVMLICKQENGDGSFKIYSNPNVDLCGKHDTEYRLALAKFELDVKDGAA